MQFTDGARVYTAEGQEVGRITHMVLNPVTKKASHIVVRQGVIFTENKVIPMDWIEDATSEKAVLRAGISDLQDLPRFEESHFVPVEHSRDAGTGGVVATVGGLYLNPPVDLPVDAYGVPDYRFIPERRYAESTMQNIPDDTMAVKEGARVYSADDQHVGHIESMIVDPRTEYVTHIVISQGLLLKTRKRVPAFWCEFIEEDAVHLAVDAEMLNNLPAYEPTA